MVGFDDIGEAAYFSPALTTVRQPLRKLGFLAGQPLLSQIGGAAMPIPGNLVTLPAELVIRASASRPMKERAHS